MKSYIVPGAQYQTLSQQMIQDGRDGLIFNDLDLFADSGDYIRQTQTGPPVWGTLNKRWRYRASTQRIGRGQNTRFKVIVIDGSLDLVNDPNAYSHVDTWKVLHKVIANYRGYEKHYGSIPKLAIREIDDIEGMAVSFGSGPPSSIPLGIILEDGTPTWPSNLMLKYEGPVIIACDYQEYAREVLSKLGSGSGSTKPHNFAQIGVESQMAIRFITDPSELGKKVVEIVEKN